MPSLATLRVLPTEMAIEALPEYDATSRRLLTHWIKDKLLISKVLNEQFGMPWPHETVVDAVHYHWMQQVLKQ